MILSQLLPEIARVCPMNAAMKSKEQTLTYEELLRQVNSVAGGFEQLSIMPGDRVALIGNPSPHLVIAEYAAAAIGAVPFAIFPSLAIPEIAHILEDAAPAAIIFDSTDDKIAELITSAASAAQHLVSCQSGSAAHSIEDFISNKPHFVRIYEADPDDIALIIYTGGTTGRSKGVMHTHRGLRNWSSMNTRLGSGYNRAKKSIVANLAHLTGQFVVWTSLIEGGCLIFPDSYPLTAEETVTIIEREQLRNLGTVGLLLRDIVNLPGIKQRQLQSIEAISCGGAPISETTLRKAREIFPHAQLIEVYSQTESGNFISSFSINECMQEERLNRLQSVGKPSHTAAWGQEIFEVRVVDNAGDDVKSGAAGEIICRGPSDHARLLE
ncbi:AMP-binding protein [Paenibacillus solisilvae]|uniref:AMP-binding protein n=1 Tax=Paenibacillus solisilvae TaxID=2486751 RepID=A0ABW0W1Z7_9BACL